MKMQDGWTDYIPKFLWKIRFCSDIETKFYILVQQPKIQSRFVRLWIDEILIRWNDSSRWDDEWRYVHPKTSEEKWKAWRVGFSN